MAKSNRVSGVDQDGSSSANPRAAGRRRLLRAMGGSGGVVLTTILSSRWVRPVVKSVVLPAHAQISPSNEPCLVSLEATFGPTSSNSAALAYSVSLAVYDPSGGTSFLGQSAESTGGSVTLAGDSTFPPAAGSYSLGLVFSAGSLASFAAAFNASCCDESRASPDIGYIGFVTAISSLRYVTIDDGSCSFLNP
ncbi:MAG: hypothetical protein WAL83_09205 [Arenicellales bacterium]